jgi:hypothetical protein
VPDGRDWRLDVLDSWPRLGRLVLLVLFFGVIIGTPAFFIARSLSSKATEVQFGSARVLLSQSTKEGQEFVLQVSAQGWENTGVPVPEGTRYEIDAWGRVCTDLTDLVAALNARSKAEDRVKKLKDPKCEAPEDCFTGAEIEAMKPPFCWVGPEGASVEQMRTANPKREQRRILPSAPYGALLASFMATPVEVSMHAVPERLKANVFHVTSGQKMTATDKLSGYLYFAVNDVVWPDPRFPDMFMIDNVGTFYVRVLLFSK